MQKSIPNCIIRQLLRFGTAYNASAKADDDHSNATDRVPRAPVIARTTNCLPEMLRQAITSVADHFLFLAASRMSFKLSFPVSCRIVSTVALGEKFGIGFERFLFTASLRFR
jgi:hypothetical protein